MRRLAGGIATAISGLACASAVAADLPTKKASPAPIVAPAIPSSWQFEVTAYGWASSVAGQAGFGSFPSQEYYAPFSKLLEHLEGGLMGSVTARNDTFIFGLDAIWTKLGGGGTILRRDSALFGGSTELVLTEAIVTAFGGVRIPLPIPNLELYGTAGARYYNSGTTISISNIYGIGASQSVNKDWIMPVAGFAANYRFDDRWFMNVFADLGGWSDSATGQALASIGYKWTPNIATTLGYRVMYTYERQEAGFDWISFQPASFRYQQWMYGPFAGLKFTF